MNCFEKVWKNVAFLDVTSNKGIKLIKNQFIGVNGTKIAYIGDMEELKSFTCKQIYNAKNKILTPSLIDCHTHLIYGGNRNDEFEQRLKGITYAKIAQNGGGINATINATREISFKKLYKLSKTRLKALMNDGVGVVEIKSGYGLDTKSELKMLKVAKKLQENFPIHIQKTFLGAHAVPKEYQNNSDLYIEYICNEMMEKVSKHVDAVDAYCEHLAFSVKQVQKVFKKAKSLGLRVKLHAEQFSLMDATKLACKYNALSTDHLEYIDESSIKQMAKSGTIAVLLPGAYYFLRETKMPPIELFRKHKVPIAIATDLNPGTSSLCSLQLIMNMASVIFNLRVDEILKAVTINGAKALGLQSSKGSIEVGKDADFCIWDVEHPRDLVCSFRPTTLHKRVFQGSEVHV